jgi:hypothetical protein
VTHPRWPDRLVRATLVAIVAGVVVVADRGGFEASRSGLAQVDGAHTGDEAAAQATRDQFETLRREVAAVPAGERVYLRPDSEWQQRIVEFALMDHLVVVPAQAQADYVISVAHGSGDRAAGGVHVRTARTR